jgi:hypothetical protein
MQPTISSSYSRQQYIRDILELARQRMLSKVSNMTINSAPSPSSSPSVKIININQNITEIIVGVGYICIILVFIMKIIVGTIENFEYYYMSPSYNRFGFIVNEEYETDDETSDESDHENENDNLESPPSPILLRHTLSSKCIHLKTPIQTMNAVAVTPKTPLPVRRSLRLKIKSELNLSAMEHNNKVMTRSQTKQNRFITVSSDPCPINIYRTSTMTTPSPHPEHDEELAYYIQYCNEKKMRKQRPEFNSPLFVRRLVL